MTYPGIPNTEDHDTAGFFEAATRHEIAVRACNKCGLVLHLPKAYCHACGDFDTGWKTVSPTGTVWSFTTTERELRPGFTPPYTVVMVDLDDAPGARVTGYIPGRAPLKIGQKMKATFQDIGDGIVLPNWEPAEA